MADIRLEASAGSDQRDDPANTSPPHRGSRAWWIIFQSLIVMPLLLGAGAGTLASPVAGTDTRTSAAPAAPRIAVAFGGGSALGLSHIGFLRWMAEHHVPIHAVAGTSMGGLIGGLYATGYSADEIASFVQRIDWQRALERAPPYSQLSFRRKEDRRDFGSPLEFGLRGGKLSLPDSVSPGSGVGLLISSFAAPYGELRSFEDLPTPFRCTAVDLISGQAVTFTQGSLLDALRSTMSIPGFFSPWKSGEMLLVDGGVLNNLPTDVAKAMGADVVIGVELESPPLAPKPTFNLLRVASRSLDIMISNNERRNMALADILVMPDLTGFASMDYDRSAELIERGYAAAEKKARQLLAYAVADAEWAHYLAGRAARRKFAPAKAEFLVLEGADEKLGPLIERHAAEYGSLPTDEETLGDKLSAVTENGRFASVDYSFLSRDGKDGIDVRLHEKQHGPPFLDTGLLIDTNQRDGTRFGFGARVTFLDFGGPLSELRLDLNVGGFNQAGAEYYWRPGSRSFFFAPNFSTQVDSLPYYNGHFETARISAWDVRGGADLGLAMGRNAEIRVGYVLAHSSYRTESGAATFPGFAGRWHLLRTRMIYDLQDAAVIPSRGFRVAFEANRSLTAPLGERAGGTSVDLQSSWAHRISRNYRLLTRANVGWTSKDVFIERPFMLGGESGLYALARDQMIGNHYYYGSAMLLRALTKSSQPLYGVLGWELGKAWFTGSHTPYQDGELGVVAETPLGVLFTGVSVGASGERKILFHLGRRF